MSRSNSFARWRARAQGQRAGAYVDAAEGARAARARRRRSARSTGVSFAVHGCARAVSGSPRAAVARGRPRGAGRPAPALYPVPGPTGSAAAASFRGRPNCVHLEAAGAIGLVNSTRALAEGNAPGLRGHAPPAAFTLSFASKAEAAAWADAAREQRDGGAFSPEKLAAQAAALEEAKASAAAATEALAAQRVAASDARPASPRGAQSTPR